MKKINSVGHYLNICRPPNPLTCPSGFLDLDLRKILKRLRNIRGIFVSVWTIMKTINIFTINHSYIFHMMHSHWNCCNTQKMMIHTLSISHNVDLCIVYSSDWNSINCILITGLLMSHHVILHIYNIVDPWKFSNLCNKIRQFVLGYDWTTFWNKLEQLERLHSEDTPRRLMITHTIESYWIPSQKKTKSKLQI